MAMHCNRRVYWQRCSGVHDADQFQGARVGWSRNALRVVGVQGDELGIQGAWSGAAVYRNNNNDRRNNRR
jgi:hypothetical protein